MTEPNAQTNDEPQVVDVTITAPDADWLRQHCTMLIEQRLAASANIIPAIDSIYRWRGEVHRGAESLAILHTQAAHMQTIVRLTNQHHPYDVVHILSTANSDYDDNYHRWIVESTS